MGGKAQDITLLFISFYQSCYKINDFPLMDKKNIGFFLKFVKNYVFLMVHSPDSAQIGHIISNYNCPIQFIRRDTTSSPESQCVNRGFFVGNNVR